MRKKPPEMRKKSSKMRINGKNAHFWRILAIFWRIFAHFADFMRILVIFNFFTPQALPPSHFGLTPPSRAQNLTPPPLT